MAALGAADRTLPNPFHRLGREFRFYDLARIEAAVGHPDVEASLARRARDDAAAASRATLDFDRRREETMASVRALVLEVPDLDGGDLGRRAAAEAARRGQPLTGGPGEGMVVATLRHATPGYEEGLALIGRRAGRFEAYLLLRARIGEAIARKRPDLAAQVDRERLRLRRIDLLRVARLARLRPSGTQAAPDVAGAGDEAGRFAALIDQIVRRVAEGGPEAAGRRRREDADVVEEGGARRQLEAADEAAAGAGAARARRHGHVRHEEAVGPASAVHAVGGPEGGDGVAAAGMADGVADDVASPHGHDASARPGGEQVDAADARGIERAVAAGDRRDGLEVHRPHQAQRRRRRVGDDVEAHRGGVDDHRHDDLRLRRIGRHASG